MKRFTELFDVFTCLLDARGAEFISRNIMTSIRPVGAGTVWGIRTPHKPRFRYDATAEDVCSCDGLAVSSPTNMGLRSWKMKRLWDETMMDHWMKVGGKIACDFSSGGWGGGS